MDWVVSQQLLSQRLLEKQLNEIEAKKRQNEARRLRQIRDVGVDLARMQKSTRDLDDVIEELSPRQQPRRGSLPCLDSTGGLSSYFQPSAAPRSKRRISCIAAIPAHQINQLEVLAKNRERKTSSMTQDKDKQSGKLEHKGSRPNSNTGTPGQRRNSKQGDVTSNTPTSGKGNISSSGKTTSSDLAEPRAHRLTGRRGSGGGNGSPRKNDSQVASHNVTAVYVHQDTHGPGSDVTEVLSEAESQSMFVSARNRRRASEPALGGYYITGLQNQAMDEIPAFLQQNVIENEELKKSIETNLPSDLVAETEEEEAEILSDVGEEKKEEGDEAYSKSRVGGKLTSIRETEQDGDDVTIDVSERSKRGSTDSKASRGTRDSSPGKPSLAALRQRRKSEGDVLKFNKIWKLRSSGRAQSGKGRVKGADNNDDDDDDDEEEDEQDEIWNAVRKCRYIRGYEPPEMKQPQDLGEYVFGHRDPQSTPPEQ